MNILTGNHDGFTRHALEYQKRGDQCKEIVANTLNKLKVGRQRCVYPLLMIYDDEITVDFEEDNLETTCTVLLDRSNESLPFYVHLGHKYHLLRLAAQMLLVKEFLPECKVQGKLQYRNQTTNFYFNRSVMKELIEVIGNIHENKIDGIIPNSYRCMNCNFNTKCTELTREVREMIEQRT
ncbi:MAG: hypothetical protein DWB56_17285 [Candidatus Jettenia sp.]|nr:hypothetical protein [Candidatus Jettenia sp.]